MTCVTELAGNARLAQRSLATRTRRDKDAALAAMAKALRQGSDQILEANRRDIERARQAGISEAMIDRLSLDESRVEAMAEGLCQLANLADPVGTVVRGWNLTNGVKVEQVRVPLGVVGIIYEARPNVTVDAAGICLKSGNAALLRGSSSALNSNRAIVTILQSGLREAGFDSNVIALVEGGHETTEHMMNARGLIDVLIPRGGAGLINAVVSGSTVPVIETGTGNCHLYVDRAADFDMALAIMVNAKTQRPSVCNAVETMLVHRDIAESFIPQALDALEAEGVTVHGEEVSCGIDARIVEAGEHEYEAEYLSLDLAVKVVATIDEAIDHIRRYSTGHSETIVSHDASAQQRFVDQIDAACVLVNTSSRFVDGGEFGFGAEIGISTQKIHARGPMALPEMTSTKYVIRGDGQVRG